MKKVMFGLMCVCLVSMAAQGQLVAYWGFEDAAAGTAVVDGTVFAEQYGNDATVWNSGEGSFIAGPSGTAWNITNTGAVGDGHRDAGWQWARTSATIDLVGKDFTIAAWVNPTNTSRSTVFAINPTGGTYVNARTYIVEVGANDLKIDTYNGAFSTSTDKIVSDGTTWSHIAVVGVIAGPDPISGINKVNVTMYVNGKVEGTTQLNAIDLVGGSSCSLGAYSYSLTVPASYNYSFDGGMDEILVYDHAFTAEQIANLPEPATMAILGLGALLIRRKR
jgi:hypothetical protein